MQRSSFIRSGDISRTMTPIWEKNGKNGHHHHFSGLPYFSHSLTNTQHHLGITTNFSLQELKFERKRSFLAWFVQEILVEPWHHFEKKGQKRPPPSLIRFAAFLPLSDEYPASSKYNHLFPSSKALVCAQAQLSSLIRSGDISRTMAPIWVKSGKKLPPPTM